MKILYLMKQDPDETLRELTNHQKKTVDVTIVDMRKEKDYHRIIDLIAASDKVVSW